MPSLSKIKCALRELVHFWASEFAVKYLTTQTQNGILNWDYHFVHISAHILLAYLRHSFKTVLSSTYQNSWTSHCCDHWSISLLLQYRTTWRFAQSFEGVASYSWLVRRNAVITFNLTYSQNIQAQ